ncbi:MAG: tetratricopeptide repeat protein [Aggregatilineales bacterium]
MDASKIEEFRQHAESQFRKENFANALQIFTAILEIDRNDVEARYKRALCKYSLGNVAGAIQDLSGLLEMYPDNVSARIKRAEYAYYLQMSDLDVLVEQLPAHCQQYYGKYPNVHDLPQDIRTFTYKVMELFVERAREAEREDRLADAVKYWQAYHDCGVKIDYDLGSSDVQRIIQRLTWQIAARSGDL